jgi:spermidine/putrescine transport system permease protein
MFKNARLLKVWVFIFIIIPIALLILSAVTSYSILGFDRFRLEGDAFAVLNSDVFLRALLNSLKFALLVTFFTLLIGYPVAYFLSRSESPYKRLFVLALIVPVWSNMLLRIIAFEKLFYPESILNMFGISLDLIGTDIGILIGMISIYLPFMIFPIYSVLEKINPDVLEAAYDLYASPFKRFTNVIIPLSKGGIVSGILMTALPSMTTFALPARLSAGNVILLGNLIENYVMRTAQIDIASVIALLLLVIMIGFYRVLLRFDAEGETLI